MASQDYHTSNIVGSTIINAVTGKPYNNCYVGSKSENLFFRVIDSTGYCNTTGSRTFGNRTPNKLFYDSKEQYIEHRLKMLNHKSRGRGKYI